MMQAGNFFNFGLVYIERDHVRCVLNFLSWRIERLRFCYNIWFEGDINYAAVEIIRVNDLNDSYMKMFLCNQKRHLTYCVERSTISRALYIHIQLSG